ncbi:MAG: energy-coupling factor transporter ATPase [Firmicutes bacterium]|nr:energy-coupling factor transporter ATPase [Bacillota bacterium]
MLLISLSKVDYSYQLGSHESIKALNNCSLSISSGQFVAITGSNGSGKSTLAKHLNALLLPDSGKVTVDGMDTSTEDRVWEIRRRVGLVFQNPDNQLVASVAAEDVAFGPENLGLPVGEIKKRVNYYLDLLGLSDVRDHPPHMLSGGQKQRLAIAGVLAMEPRYLVLDEPTAMLDPSGRAELLNAITHLNKQLNITVVLITHLMNEAVLADRVILMGGGKIIMDKPPREFFAQEEIIKQNGLRLPEVVHLAKKLKEKGFELNQQPLTIDEVVDSLCGL